MIHGGFFVGTGCNRAYVHGTKICFDDCDCDSWSALWLDDVIEELGYEGGGRIDVYWLLPGMQINEDGLRLIKDDKDALSMVAQVQEGYRYLMLYLDHDPARKAPAWDDVSANPILPLPDVISPSKQCTTVSTGIVQTSVVSDVQGGAVRRSKREALLEKEGDSGSDSDSDYEPEIVDSDNDIEDGDDDLYLEYADQEPKEDKKEGVPEDQMSDDGDFFEAPGSDDEAEKFNNFKPFAAQDMEDPKFHTGQLFQSIDQLKKAVREHSCKHRKPIKFPKNDQTRLLGKCKVGCPWELYASWDNRTKCIMVKRYEAKHTCESKWQVWAFTSNVKDIAYR